MVSRRLIRETALRAALFFVLLEANLVVSVLFYPDFAKNMPVWLSIAPIPALRDILATLEEFGFPAYVVAQQFFKAANTLGTAAAAIFAMGTVAREVENRTIEFLVTRPVGRGCILASRFALGGAGVAIPVFVSSASAIPLAGLAGETIPAGPLLLASLHASLFLLVLYAAAFLLSTVSSDQGRVVFVVLGFATLSFALYMVNEVTHFSIYRLSDVLLYMEIFEEGRLPAGRDAILLGALAALYALAHWRFVRRDF